jgi:hypothetical protein
MLSNDTYDILALEYAFTYYAMRAKGASIDVLAELESLAIRTIGKDAFLAALGVVPKNMKTPLDKPPFTW